MKITPTTKMWRTLIRIESVNKSGVYVIIPGWSVKTKVFIDKKNIPPVIFNAMTEGGRYHVQCNIGAECLEDLRFNNWEKSKL